MNAKAPKKAVSVFAMVTIMASLIVLVLAAAATAWSQTTQAKDPQADKKQVAKKVEPAVSVSGQKTAIDPETKKLRQLTPEEAQALSEDLKNYLIPGEVKIYQYPNGMLAAELPEEYMDAVVVKRNADGTLSTECVRGMKAAAAHVQSAPAAPAGSGQDVSKSKIEEKKIARTPEKATPKPNFEEKE